MLKTLSFQIYPVTKMAATLARKNYGEYQDILFPESVKLHECDFCYKHKKMCRRLPYAGKSDELTLLVAGSPCPDYSSFGQHAGQVGKTGHLFVILKLGLTASDSS